jgi:hypothetical protein
MSAPDNDHDARRFSAIDPSAVPTGRGRGTGSDLLHVAETHAIPS